MLVTQPVNVATSYEPMVCTAATPTGGSSAQAAASPSSLFFGLDDDEDEALQAVLLASLMASAPEEQVRNAEQEKAFEAAVKPPLVAMPSSLAAFGEEASVGEAIQRALASLEQTAHLKLSKVRGDGHCLFRVFGAALVLGGSWYGTQAADALLAHVTNQSLPPHASEVGSLVATVLESSKATPSAAFEALNDEADGAPGGQALVAALRRCAVAYMQSAIERFRHCADSPDDFGGYCEGMSDMGLARYGGHPELVALSEALQVRVDIYDTSALGPVAHVPTYRFGEHLPATAPIVRALRRGLHYNLLLCATAEGDALPPAAAPAKASTVDEPPQIS